MARKSTPKAAEPEAPAMLALIETPNIVEATPLDQARIVLLDPQRFDQFYDRVKAETTAHVPDVSTVAGREALRSLAFRVTKTATTLDKSALELTKGWRDQVAAVNAARMPMVERMKALAAEVRKPLTEWEQAEEARMAANRAVIDDIVRSAVVTAEDTSETVAERGRRIWALAFDAPQWLEDEAVEARAAKDRTVATLVVEQKRLKQVEADRAELAQLRAEREAREAREAAEAAERERIAAEEAAARQAAEEAERVAREAQERAEREAREAAERERQAAERAERAAQEAADKARREAEEAAAERERAAQAERDRIEAERQAEHERQLAAERAERERIEAAAAEERAAAERARLAEAARLRQIEADRAAEAEAERKRQANRAHRAQVQGEVKAAIMTCGVDEPTAKAIVLAIVAGNVPHCTVAF